MQIRVGFEMAFSCPQPTPMLLVLNIHHSRASDLVRPDLITTTPAVPMTAYRDLFGIIAEAKRAQVDALNAQQFSVDEYGWVKHRFYEAAGVALTGVDFRELAEQMKDGNFGALQKKDDATAMTTDTPGIGIPDANRTLVAPYKEKLNAWMVYGAFGL